MHRHTKNLSDTTVKFLQLTNTSTPPALGVSPWESLWSVPPDATITVTIGISSTSNYCQEQGFYFPQALMILSTLGTSNSVSSRYSTTCIWIFSHRWGKTQIHLFQRLDALCLAARHPRGCQPDAPVRLPGRRGPQIPC